MHRNAQLAFLAVVGRLFASGDRRRSAARGGSSVIVECVDLSWLWSPKDYWYAVVSAVIGAGIGISWTNGQFRKQRVRDAAKCLSRLRACLAFNIERLNQAIGQLQQNIIPNYPLDTAQLNHWLSQSHGVIPDNLLRSLDWQRYQLDHLSSKFVSVSQSIILAQSFPAAVQPNPAYTNALITSLTQHVETILNELPPLIAQIPNNAEPGAAVDGGA